VTDRIRESLKGTDVIGTGSRRGKNQLDHSESHGNYEHRESGLPDA
jgi:hypothetical protein